MNSGVTMRQRQEETSIARDATTPRRIEDEHVQRARAELRGGDVFLGLER
jgi:hypothetical protein